MVGFSATVEQADIMIQNNNTRCFIVRPSNFIEQDVRLLSDVNSAVPNLESGRLMQTARENLALVGSAIAVFVLEDQ